MKYTIETGIKIPTRNGKWSTLEGSLGIGDSVVMSREDSRRFAEHLRRKEIVHTRRKIQDPESVQETYRIWRQS